MDKIPSCHCLKSKLFDSELLLGIIHFFGLTERNLEFVLSSFSLATINYRVRIDKNIV